MSNNYYSGAGGVVYRSTEGLITRVGTDIPAGTLLASSMPIQNEGDAGLYFVEVYLTSFGGANNQEVFAHFLKHPGSLIGGSYLATGANATSRATITVVPMLLGNTLTLATVTPCKADYIWGYIKHVRDSSL